MFRNAEVISCIFFNCKNFLYLIAVFFLIVLDVGLAANFYNTSTVSDTTNTADPRVDDKLPKSKIIYPEYQVEIIAFNLKNNQNHLIPTKEILVEDFKIINKRGTVDISTQYVKPNFLLKSYDKLKSNSNYQIIFYSAAKYHLLPSQKIKKFLITSTNTHDIANEFVVKDNSVRFDIILSILQVKNNFNITFDGNINKYSLTKSAKLKSKEVYYFDHPMFGALVTIVELNKDKL